MATQSDPIALDGLHRAASEVFEAALVRAQGSEKAGIIAAQLLTGELRATLMLELSSGGVRADAFKRTESGELDRNGQVLFKIDGKTGVAS